MCRMYCELADRINVRCIVFIDAYCLIYTHIPIYTIYYLLLVTALKFNTHFISSQMASDAMANKRATTTKMKTQRIFHSIFFFFLAVPAPPATKRERKRASCLKWCPREYRIPFQIYLICWRWSNCRRKKSEKRKTRCGKGGEKINKN